MKTCFKIFIIVALSIDVFSQVPPCRSERIEINYYLGLVDKIPYLKTDMPEEIIKSYIRYDSLRKSQLIHDFYDYIDKNLYSKEVDIILKDYYIMLDYDYEIFQKNEMYDNDTILMSSSPFVKILSNFIRKRFGNVPILEALLNSSHLLKVQLNNYDYRYDYFRYGDIHIYEGKILSTCKGNVTAACKSIEIPADSTKYIYQNPSSKNNNIDSCIQIYHNKSSNIFQTNKDCYTFVNYVPFCINRDSGLAFFSPDIIVKRDDDFPLHHALLLVENDSVYDPDNFFIPEGVISENEWLKRVNDNIAKIKNMDYTSSSVKSINKSSIFHLYPNPAKTNVSIDFIVEPENLSNVTVELYNLTGILQSKLDYNVDYNNSNSLGTLNCNIENIPNGYYIIVIDNGKHKVAKPFIVNKN